MSTPDALTASARPAGTAWNGPVSTGLPTTGTRVKLNPPKDPAMMRNQTRKCVTKSETPQNRAGRPEGRVGVLPVQPGTHRDPLPGQVLRKRPAASHHPARPPQSATRNTGTCAG